MLEDQLNNIAKDTASLIRYIRQQQKQINDLKQSSSWRISAPFRWASSVIKQLFTPPLSDLVNAASLTKTYAEWIRDFDSANAVVCTNVIEQIASFPHLPLFSVLLPVNDSNVEKLDAIVESVCQQLYPHWELCIVTGAEISVDIHASLTGYAQKESRIKIASSTAVDMVSLHKRAFEMVSDKSDWVFSLGNTFSIARHAIFMFAKTVNEHETSQIIYIDEDVINLQGMREGVDFKPDWNLDLHLSRNLIGSCGVYRTALVKSVGGYQGGMAEDFYFDLSLRCIERTLPVQIVHLPYLLHTSTAASKITDAGVQAVNAHFSRVGIDASAENIGHGYRIHYALPKALPLVSLIIPTRNGVDLLRVCIESIQQKTDYAHYEIIVIDNGSDEAGTLEYFRLLKQHKNIRILRIDTPFNYSALNNAAVKVAGGELIALLNNDIEVISQEWLSEMVSHALRPDVGVVGARLWFPNDTLQHGGVVLGLGGVAGHAHMGLARGEIGYQGRAGLVQNFSALTAACIVVKKSIYEAVGGLNEQDLVVAFNDIDFCLRVREAGYRNVWTPFAELYHHESASRGYEETPEKQRRLASEKAYMHQRWGMLLQTDPAYSPNLTLEANDFSLAWPPRVPSLVKFSVEEPSLPSLSERLSHLTKRKVRVAYFAENVHSSTYRYRASNMVTVLNEDVAPDEVQTSAACFFSCDLHASAHIVKNADWLIISRARYDPALLELVEAFRSQGKRILFDIDDLVFDSKAIDLIITTSGQKSSDEQLHYWYGVVGRMAQMLGICDAAITTNTYLATKIKQCFTMDVSIVPNFLNKEQLAISESLYRRNLTHAYTSSERIKLGYFSGSSSHNGDLALISHALERVMAVDARIDLVLVGYVDLEQAFGARFGGYLKGHLSDRVTIHPFVDFLTLQELIADVDFNLVPLQVNDFTHCKSELKYVDAAIVGTLTLASPTHAYAHAISHGDNGYIAEDGEWEAVLLQAIALRDNNIEQHRRMIVAAYQDVQQRFTWQTQRHAILQALEIVDL